MSDYLTNSLDAADALVDVANVARNENLGGSGRADLARVDHIAIALAELYNDERVTLFGIADQSLFTRELFDDPWRMRRLNEWRQLMKILVVPKADVRLLAAGDETGLPIISGDRFRGHWREFPYLNERDDALLEPWVDGEGNVRLRHPELGARPDWELSRIEEIDVLLQQGIDRHRDDVLSRFWSCPDERCPRHEPASKPFVLLPLLSKGRLICDLHGLEMEDRGPRPRMAQLKIVQDGMVRDRFTVAEGQPVVVGRSGVGVELHPYLNAAGRAHVSRAHLRFDLDETGLTITDLSTNGTILVPGEGRPALPLHRSTRPFAVGGRAEIVPGLEIVRSGRQYPSELPVRQVPAARQPSGAASGATAMWPRLEPRLP